MKQLFLLSSICILILSLTTVCAQSTSASKQIIRAHENDTVWVIINPVKADKRE